MAGRCPIRMRSQRGNSRNCRHTRPGRIACLGTQAGTRTCPQCTRPAAQRTCRNSPRNRQDRRPCLHNPDDSIDPGCRHQAPCMFRRLHHIHPDHSSYQCSSGDSIDPGCRYQGSHTARNCRRTHPDRTACHCTQAGTRTCPRCTHPATRRTCRNSLRNHQDRRPCLHNPGDSIDRARKHQAACMFRRRRRTRPARTPFRCKTECTRPPHRPPGHPVSRRLPSRPLTRQHPHAPPTPHPD